MPETLEKTPTDLDKFIPSPPQHRVDDKAAALEADLAERKASFSRERFVYIFCLVVLFDILIGQHVPGYVFSFTIVASVLFLIGIGKWLDFPFIHDRLDRWERLLFDAAKAKITGKKPLDTEPMSGS